MSVVLGNWTICAAMRFVCPRVQLLITPAVRANAISANQALATNGWPAKPATCCRTRSCHLVFTLPHELSPNALQFRNLAPRVDMHVEPLRLSSGETVGDELEFIAERVEVIQGFSSDRSRIGCWSKSRCSGEGALFGVGGTDTHMVGRWHWMAKTPSSPIGPTGQ